MSDLDDYAEEVAAQNARNTDEFLSRPDVIASGEKKRASQAAIIEREIAEGLRDTDGNLLGEDLPDEEG